MEPPAHVWTPGQTVDLVEYILKDPSLASSFLNPQVVDELRIPKQKKLCLQLLQRTEWMVWMRKEEWVVRGQYGLRPTEKWGDDNPVRERLRWLQMEHIRLCTRLNNFASVRALGRDSPERRIWDEYRKKGQHAWYFTYHKMWFEHSPSAMRAREAASHPHALAASVSNTGRGGPCVEIIGNIRGVAEGTAAGIEEEDDIVIISETVMVDGADGSNEDLAGQRALSATNLGKRLNRQDQTKTNRSKRSKQTPPGPIPISFTSATMADPIVIDEDDDEQALPGPSSMVISTTTLRQTSTLASRIGGRATIETTRLGLRIGASSSVARVTTTTQRVSLASRIGASSSVPESSTTDRRRIPLALRLDQRPPTPPRQISRSPSDSDSSSRPSLTAATTATPSPAICTPPRDADDLDRLLQPRKYAREAAIAKRLPATAPISNRNAGDESDDDHLLHSSDFEEVPLEEDRYQGILLDQDGPTLGFGMISGKIAGLRPKLTLEGDESEYRPMTPPLPFTIGTLPTPDMPLLVLGENDDNMDDPYYRPETPPLPFTIGDELSPDLPLLLLSGTNHNVHDRSGRPTTPPLPISKAIQSSTMCVTNLAEDEEAVRRLVSPISALQPDTAHTTISHLLGRERTADVADDDDDVIYLGEHLGEAEDAFLDALSGVIGMDT